MRTILIAVGLLAIFSMPGVALGEEPNLHARELHTLRGINEVSVFVSYIGLPPPMRTLSEYEVANIVIGRLKQAGLTASDTIGTASGTSAVLDFKVEDREDGKVVVRMTLQQRVALVRDPKEWFLATTWHDYTIGDAVLDAVLDAMNLFVVAWENQNEKRKP